MSTIREAASHCEAKKHALRQTQDGIVVSFVLHPNEVPASLQLAPLGTRYMLALVEIGDDEQPKQVRGTQTTEPAPSAPVQALHFRDKPYAQQAAILGSNEKFRRFLREKFDVPIERLLSAEDAAEQIKLYCDVDSRTKILPGTKAEQRWNLLVSAYRAWDSAPLCGVA